MPINERIYNIPDAELLSFGNVLASTLPEDIADFSAFDSTLSDSYPLAINTAVTEVMNVRTDDVVIDEMVELTDKVNETMASCNTTYKTIRFFVKKAFTDSPAVQNQFGLNDVDKVRSSVVRMIVFMNDIGGVIKKYREELIEVGCNEAVLDKIPVLAEQLSQRKTEQEQFKKQRGVITQDRVQKLNSLYKLLKPISEIAHIIYADNAAKLAIYALPKPKSSTDNPDDILFS